MNNHYINNLGKTLLIVGGIGFGSLFGPGAHAQTEKIGKELNTELSSKKDKNTARAQKKAMKEEKLELPAILQANDVTNSGVDMKMKGKQYFFEDDTLFYKIGDRVFQLPQELNVKNYIRGNKNANSVSFSANGKVMIVFIDKNNDKFLNTALNSEVKFYRSEDNGELHLVDEMHNLKSLTHTRDYSIMIYDDLESDETTTTRVKIYDKNNDTSSIYLIEEIEEKLKSKLPENKQKKSIVNTSLVNAENNVVEIQYGDYAGNGIYYPDKKATIQVKIQDLLIK